MDELYYVMLKDDKNFKFLTFGGTDKPYGAFSLKPYVGKVFEHMVPMNVKAYRITKVTPDFMVADGKSVYLANIEEVPLGTRNEPEHQQ